MSSRIHGVFSIVKVMPQGWEFSDSGSGCLEKGEPIVWSVGSLFYLKLACGSIVEIDGFHFVIDDDESMLKLVGKGGECPISEL